jgi:hypothetical protein
MYIEELLSVKMLNRPLLPSYFLKKPYLIYFLATSLYFVFIYF